MEPTKSKITENQTAIIAALVISIILGILLWLFVFKKSDKKPVIEVVGPSVGPSVPVPVETVDVIEDALTGGTETPTEPEGYRIRK